MTQQTEPVQPKFSHYVSLHNNSIHPAMTSPAGYEDDHPTEWRGATSAEVARYKTNPASNDSVVPKPLPLSAAHPDAVLTPSSITLQDDEPSIETNAPFVPEAPVVAEPSQPAPGAPVAPAPITPAFAIPSAPALGAGPTSE